MHVQKNGYARGDIVYLLNEQNQKEWYYAALSSNLYNINDNSSGWIRITREYQSRTSRSKYDTGELIIYQGKYYIVTTSGGYEILPTNGNHYQVENRKGIYNQNTIYQRGDVVSVDFYDEEKDTTTTKEFIWMDTINTIGLKPGTVQSYWRELTDEWTPYSKYKNTSLAIDYVSHENKLYYWSGTDNSNSTESPGTKRNGWVELTENFAPFNNYYKDDYVIHDGSLWQAKMDVPSDPITGSNIIPRGIGSYVVWREVASIFNVGRN